MFPRITNVEHIKEYLLGLTFTDGIEAEIDFAKCIIGRGGVFKSLQDIAYFKLVCVDKEIGTIVWPNEIDFDPDVLYSEATGKPIETLLKAT